MPTSFKSVSFTPQPGRASWCFLVLEHLDEFASWHGISQQMASSSKRHSCARWRNSIRPHLNLPIQHSFTVRLERFSSPRRLLCCRTRAEKKMRTGFTGEFYCQLARLSTAGIHAEIDNPLI